VNSTRDTVLELEVHLGNSIIGENGGIRDIAYLGVCQLEVNGRGFRSEDERIAADSTMFRMVNLLIALSFGVHLEQLEHRMGLTWPRPFLLRPL
jgi:hypothetical protein